MQQAPYHNNSSRDCSVALGPRSWPRPVTSLTRPPSSRWPFPEPQNQKQIPEFVGLANYFRFLIQDFALYTGKLTYLFYKKSTYTSEPLPEKAQSTFHHLQIALSSEPLVSHTRSDLNFSLTTDATMGDAASPGGMGAVLSQTGEDGVEHVESRPTS